MFDRLLLSYNKNVANNKYCFVGFCSLHLDISVYLLIDQLQRCMSAVAVRCCTAREKKKKKKSGLICIDTTDIWVDPPTLATFFSYPLCCVCAGQ